jgi:catechol 2,3-dioxygenase-like lactoylglutathione lyase family enzyme
MHLEHLNLVVNNLERALTFYRAVFPHWDIRDRGEGDWYGVMRKWVHFGDDHHYLTLNDNGTDQIRDIKSNQLGLAHFAYVVANLDSIVSRLADAGFKPHHNGAVNPFRKNVYFLDPDGFEVEFVEYLSDLPQERNNSLS